MLTLRLTKTDSGIPHDTKSAVHRMLEPFDAERGRRKVEVPLLANTTHQVSRRTAYSRRFQMMSETSFRIAPSSL